MTKKYNNLKNLTPEEFKEYKNKQRRVIQKRYYDNHKEEINRRNKNKYNYSKTYKERIDKAINYIEEKGRLKYNPKELIKILKGEKL